MGMCLSVQHSPKAETHDNLINSIKTKMVIQQKKLTETNKIDLKT